MFKFKLLLFVYFLLMLSSCVNPMGNLKPEIEKFKKNHSQNFSFVDAESGKIHYVWSGDKSKRALVFVHGSPGSWEGWAKYLNDESLQKKFHIIAIDRPGYGKSNKGKVERSLSKQADAILKVLATNQSQKPAILVGHSFGGPVVASASMNHPTMIGGLLFIASSVDPNLEKTKWIQYPATWWPIRSLLPKVIRVCNEEIMSLKNELILQTDSWDKINSKVAIIQGLDDTLVPPGNTDYLLKKIDANLIVSNQLLPKMGHFVIWQKHELVVQEILNLERHIQLETASKTAASSFVNEQM